jgi:hypothetical protein
MANTHSLDLERDSSQFADRADNASLSITGNLSIAMWVKRETDGGDRCLFSKWKALDNEKSYAFELNTGDVLAFFASGDGSAQTIVNSTTTVTAAGGWTHVAVTYNAAAGTCQFYKNGSAIESGSGLPTSLHDNASRPSLGKRTSSGGSDTAFYDGLMDEVVVTADILTAGEITGLYGGGNPVTLLDNLRLYLALDDNYTDGSGNGNSFTASGSPVFSTDVPFSGAVAVGGMPIYFY